MRRHTSALGTHRFRHMAPMGFVTWLPWVSSHGVHGFRYECAATRRRLATASAVVCFCGIVTGRPWVSSRGVQGFHHGASMGFVRGLPGVLKSGHQPHSVAIIIGRHQWPSSLTVISGRHQWPSSVAVISGRHHQSLYHHWPSSVAFISGRHQWPSSVAVSISGLHQWSSSVANHQLQS